MEKHESVIILKADLNKGQFEEFIGRLEEKLKKYVEITKKEDLGIKRLAYEIKQNKIGHYLIYQFDVKREGKYESIKEIERFYRISDEIIKFITVRCEGEI